ncbi:hypothetical protein R50073_28050 [Maricurvus nonylphenolicus]|uniref:cytochrome-c peroxidase n=1 Tax=Maricurvus nonylphenolicus TaxID=1008307 RepID=UPI0036F43677
MEETIKGFQQWICVLALSALLSGCEYYQTDSESNTDLNIFASSQTQYFSTSALTPIPDKHNEPLALATLGEQLFNDTTLSSNQSISCASCHRIDQGGDDNRATSVGIHGQIGEVNAPTVLNAALNFRQFWDGRADTLQEQARFPVENPIEMASRWPDVIERLRQNPDYQRQFNALFDDGITVNNVTAAIASFERTLLTPDSPFDRFLNGDNTALSDQAHRGYQRFRELGCVSCHQGINIGGNMYQYLGVMRDYFTDKRELRDIDLGLYNHTGRELDRYKFKVPSLRNVAETAPYFHDGSATTLREAIIVMGRYQLGIELTTEDQELLLAFLASLSAPPLTLAKSP